MIDLLYTTSFLLDFGISLSLSLSLSDKKETGTPTAQTPILTVLLLMMILFISISRLVFSPSLGENRIHVVGHDTVAATESSSFLTDARRAWCSRSREDTV